MRPPKAVKIYPTRRRLTSGEPSIAVIVVNWNGSQDTTRCLRSLLRITYGNYLTVLVDNNSWDDSVEEIRTFCAEEDSIPYQLVQYTKREALAGGEGRKEAELQSANPDRRLVVIQNDENLGHPGGINLAVEYLASAPTRPDYVYLLDNDATIQEDCLAELVRIEQKLSCGVVGGMVLEAENGPVQYAPSGVFGDQFFPHLVRAATPENGRGKPCWPCSWVAGPSILVRWDVVEAMRSQRGALLHPGLIMHGWELEFAQSCQRAGYQPYAARDAVVYHKKHRAFGGMQSPMRYYYENRNMALLARQILPASLRLLYHAYTVPLAALRVAKSLKAGRPDIARAVAAGVADGLRGIDGKWKHHDRETIAGARHA